MEELTCSGKKKIIFSRDTNKLGDLVINEYENPDLTAFAKNACMVRKVIFKKFPMHKTLLTNEVVKKILDTSSTACSMRQKPQKRKYFYGISFYLAHPHYRWHVDLQDITIFRKAANKSKTDAYSFMLIWIDDFSNYIMVELIKNKHAVIILNAMVKIIQREKYIPILIYCDRGSEFKKLFNDPRTNGFKVQYMIDHRKAVYAERAIHMIRISLE